MCLVFARNRRTTSRPWRALRQPLHVIKPPQFTSKCNCILHYSMQLTNRAFSVSRASHSKNIMKGSIHLYIVLRNAHRTDRGRKSTEWRGNATRITRLQFVDDPHTHTHHALKIDAISRSLIHASLILWVMVQTLQECLAVWLWALGSALCPRPKITYRQTRNL